MDTTSLVLTIVGAVLGSSGLFSLIQNRFNRMDKLEDRENSKDEKIAKIIATQEKIMARLDYSDLNDSQTHLLILIQHYPHDKQAIISEAENYFIRLGGDSWVFAIVSEWAKINDVDIDYLRKAHEKNIKR